MATATLVGNPNTLANASWSDGSGFGTNGSDLIIPSGTAAITTAVDQNGATERSFTVRRGFTGTIGTPTAPLRFSALDSGTGVKTNANNEGYVELSHAQGTVYFDPGASTWDNLLVDTFGAVSHINRVVARLTLKNGQYSLAEAATVTEANIFGGTFTDSSLSAGPAFTLWNIFGGGSHTVRRVGTTLNIYGGTVTLNATVTGAFTTINIYGGRVIVQAMGSSATTTINHYGGTVDFTQISIPIAITTYNSYASARRIGRVNQTFLTITNDIYFLGANPDAQAA